MSAKSVAHDKSTKITEQYALNISTGRNKLLVLDNYFDGMNERKKKEKIESIIQFSGDTK